MGKLSAAKVRSLTAPGRYSDGDGLFLEIGRKGGASWILRATVGGRRKDFGLGSAKLISLAEAREAALTFRKQIAKGLDPIAERERERLVIPTFRQAAEIVYEEHRAGWKNNKHCKQWLATLETYAYPFMGDRPVNMVEVPQIRDALAPIWLSKPETARRVRQRIGSVLDWACAKGFRATEAPLRAISKGLPRQPRKDGHFAAMAYSDVPAFIQTLRERESVGRLALEALILTAARSGEIRGATWSELDLEAGLWTVPADRMKIGRVHVVPLAPPAIAVFERAKTFRVKASDLVFPGQNVKRPMSDMTLLKFLRDQKLTVTVHGFRSAFRDWVAEQTDFPGEVAETALAHSVSNKVEAAYRRTDYLDKRRALMSEWAAFCSGTALAKKSGG